MDKIIQSFEDLFFHLIAIVILLPKTIWKTFNPNFSYDYVTEQLLLDSKSQFKDNVSPILLLLITVIFPIYLFIHTSKSNGFKTIVENYLLSKDNSSLEILIIMSLYMCCFPIQLTLFTLIKNKQTISFDNIKTPLYIFTYDFCAIMYGPIFLNILFRLTPIGYLFNDEDKRSSGTLITISGLVLLIIILLGFRTNIFSLKKLLKKTSENAFKYAFINYVIIFVIYCFLILVIAA